MIFGKKSETEADAKIFKITEEMNRRFRMQDEENTRKVTELELSHKLLVNELKKNHELDLKQRDFDLKNNKDAVVMAANKERDAAKEESAVLKKEVEMLRGLVDVHAGIIDVKDLVGNLIKALPKVDLTSLTVNATQK